MARSWTVLADRPGSDAFDGEVAAPVDASEKAAGWHSRIDQDDDTRWRPPPLPATPTDPEPRNLASSAFTGHDRLDLVFGALLRFAA